MKIYKLIAIPFVHEYSTDEDVLIGYFLSKESAERAIERCSNSETFNEHVGECDFEVETIVMDQIPEWIK